MAVWYVRPDSGHGLTRNGTSYATAWGGWGEIVWGGAGVVGGDTLYVCGSHAYNATITIGAHGGSSASTICTIYGDYADDAGSIVFSGAAFLSNSRARTQIRRLSITLGTSSGIFVAGSANNSLYVENRFYASSTSGSSISMNGATGQNHSDVLIAGNEFYGSSSSALGTVSWFVSAPDAVSTLTRIDIRNNRFIGSGASRAIVHLRTEDDTSVSSVMTDIAVENNEFVGVFGKPIEVIHGHAIKDIGAGLRVKNNTVFGAQYAVGSTSAGGNAFGGFAASPAWGKPEIAFNHCEDMFGQAGLANVFYGAYHIHHNTGKRLSTHTIDACGVLFDHGAHDCEMYANHLEDLPGVANTENSGAGIMILDSTAIRCFSNTFVRCRSGVFLGSNATEGQSCEITGNTFVDVAVTGIHIIGAADQEACIVKNNAFTSSANAVSVKNLGTAWSKEDHNSFYGFAAASGHTLGLNDVSSDPMLSSSLRPLPGSPVLGAGTHLGYSRDLAGVQRSNPPSIGAYDVATLRKAFQ